MVDRTFGDYDRISIAQIVIYTFLLGGGVFLCIKHGFSRGSGWYFLIILGLARLVGASLYLATLHDATNTSLYIGWLTCTGISLSPLVLMIHGLLGRVFTSIAREGKVVIKDIYQRGIGLLMLAGFILVVYGNSSSHYHLTDNGRFHIDYAVESKAGMAIIIVVYVIVVLECFLAFFNQSYAAPGERRLILATAVCLPLIAVRVIYGAWSIFGDNSPSVWFYLAGSVLMEMLVMLICEVVGFTLDKATPLPDAEQGEDETERQQLKRGVFRR